MKTYQYIQLAINVGEEGIDFHLIYGNWKTLGWKDGN